MSDKSQQPRRSLRVASRHQKQPYKALLIRAQSPEQPEDNSVDNEATGSKDLEMKSKKADPARKAPYKALRMRARSPEPAHDYDSHDDDSTSSEETSSQELEVKRRKKNDLTDSEAKN